MGAAAQLVRRRGTPEDNPLVKFLRSNQGTCINQRPIVDVGDRVEVLGLEDAGLLGRRRSYDFLTASVDRANANTVRVNCWRKRVA